MNGKAKAKAVNLENQRSRKLEDSSRCSARPIAQPIIKRAGNPKTTKKSAGSHVISAGVSYIFNRNNGTASTRVSESANQNLNGARPARRHTGPISMKARKRFSRANQIC